MKFQHCIIINSSSQVCFPYFHMESFYVKRRFIMNVHKMILRFHLFVSLLHWDLLPFSVQSGLWRLQIIASFEEHFYSSADSYPVPALDMGVCIQPLCSELVADLFLTTFVLFQPRFLSNHNNVAQVEWKVSILQWCHTGCWDYLHTSICEGIFFYLSSNLSFAYCPTSQYLITNFDKTLRVQRQLMILGYWQW